MDGERGLESEVTPVGGLTVDEANSYLTITDLPVDPSSSDVPGVERKFRRPVRITALLMTLRPPQSASAPSQPVTSASTPEFVAGGRSVQVTVTLLTKKPGDTTFTPLTDDSTNQPKVKWMDMKKTSHWARSSLMFTSKKVSV